MYMEFRKMVTITLYVRQQRDTDVKNSLLDLAGEGEGDFLHSFFHLLISQDVDDGVQHWGYHSMRQSNYLSEVFVSFDLGFMYIKRAEP